MILHDEIKPYLLSKSFVDIMALKGEVFRNVDGRCTQKIIVGQQAYFIKQHFGVGWKEIIKNLVLCRLPVISAKNEWLALQRLTELKIDVPDVVGYGVAGINPATMQSFLITRELPKHISLEHFCQHWPQTPPAFKLKQKLIAKVATMTRLLHENGINHRDLYICHFLLDLTVGIDAELKLYLIDLHRAQIRQRVPMRWVVKDLAGLYFSSKDVGLTQRDLLRFIKKYRNKPLRDVLNREFNFWLKVKQRGDKLYQKHEK
jgi:hypothetical protein